jgi:hypothetical protein
LIGSRFKVQGSRFKVQGSRFQVQRLQPTVTAYFIDQDPKYPTYPIGMNWLGRLNPERSYETRQIATVSISTILEAVQVIGWPILKPLNSITESERFFLRAPNMGGDKPRRYFLDR